MNNKKTMIAALLILVIIIAIASALYGALGSDYNVSPDVTDTKENESNSTPESEENKEQDRTAPNFTVTDMDGNKVKLSDFKGKPVIINFWATWCGYCKDEMPVFEKAYKNHPEVQFLMINATDGVRETVEKAKQYISEEQYSFDVFFDTDHEAVYAYYVNAFPTTFVIDKDGNLVTYLSGKLTEDILEKMIALANKTE